VPRNFFTTDGHAQGTSQMQIKRHEWLNGVFWFGLLVRSSGSSEGLLLTFPLPHCCIECVRHVVSVPAVKIDCVAVHLSHRKGDFAGPLTDEA
jgi:hypothetical protein